MNAWGHWSHGQIKSQGIQVANEFLHLSSETLCITNCMRTQAHAMNTSRQILRNLISLRRKLVRLIKRSHTCEKLDSSKTIRMKCWRIQETMKVRPLWKVKKSMQKANLSNWILTPCLILIKSRRKVLTKQEYWQEAWKKSNPLCW